LNYLERFRVRPGTKVRLKEIDPAFKDRHENYKEGAEQIEDYQKRLGALQELLYAESRHWLLICLQAMHTGGKDGTINHVMSATNLQGCHVAVFRQPSP
jgi:polyphosphate kinase 2 (PPK2 family)